MSRMTHFLSSIVGLSCFLIVSAANWGYEGSIEPTTWSQKYPTCGGNFQSPINIENSLFVRGLNPVWSDYELVPTTMTITNNGHSISLSGNGTKPRLQVGNDRVYQLDSVHFHWGKKNSEGSEHTIRGRRYPLEMHAVHKRVVNGSLVDPPEIIVVAILFQVSYLQRNLGLDRFINSVPTLRTAETSISIQPFPWSALIQQFEWDFYVYRGSLTTPPCSEVVTFFIRAHIAKLSVNQLAIFRQLLNDENVELSGNFRPLQPLNGRNVYYAMP